MLCQVAIISESKYKRDGVKIMYEDHEMDITDIQGEKVQIVKTASYFISLQENSWMRRV